MSRRKDIALVTAGILAGIVLSNPTALAGLTANPSTQTFYLAEEKINLEAYSINGSNYVKLRDIGQAVDFGVTYDAADNSVHIEPDAPYDASPAVSVPATGAVGVSDHLLANGKPITEENVLELLRQIEQDWPAGTVWGKHTTPGTHKNEVPSAEAARIMDHYQINGVYGCGGYAAMVSSLLFGDKTNPARKLDDLSQIRPGDVLFLISSSTGKVWHVMVALESPNEVNAFHYTGGNHSAAVYWPDRQNPYGRENLDCYRGADKSYRLEAWTRYPESVSYTGGSVSAWPTGSP